MTLKTTQRRRLLGAFALALCAAPAFSADPVKIGFLVKQAEEPWFQDEWRFAEQAAHEKGFTLVKIGIPNGEKMIGAIDNLAAQKVQGFVICAPDVKLGPAVARAARRTGMKAMSVDDQLVDGSGKPVAGIPHMGISAYDALKAAGFPVQNIVDAAQAKSDTENAFNAANIAFTKHPNFKRWVAFGLNDEAVLGAVRAAEGRGMGAASMIGVGIGGSKTALNEFAKPGQTGFYGTVLISPKRHGYESTMMVYKWITENAAPPPLTLTTGTLMTRANQQQVRAQFGL